MIVPLLVGAGAVAVIAGLDRAASKAVRPVPRVGSGHPGPTAASVESVNLDSAGSSMAGWILMPHGSSAAQASVASEVRVAAETPVSHGAPVAAAASSTAPSAGEPPVVVLTHGWGRCRRYVLPVADGLVSRGFTVVMFDVRSHGENAQESFFTARQFSDDVGEIAAFARARFAGRSLALIGHSMGGAASVVAVAEGAPADAIGLIACPADVLEVTANYMREKGLPGGLLTTVLRPFWWRRTRGGFGRLAPARRLREVDLPVLVVHAENDRRVPRDHADRLAGAAGCAVSVVVDAGHSDVLHRSELIDALLVPFLETLHSRPRR